MPRLKITDDELNIDELDEAEYNEDDFPVYTGEQPPADTVLDGYIKSAWWTDTSSGDRMMKLIFIADGNEGDEEEYDGLPVWENLPFTASGKFKWKPFIDSQNLTLMDIKKKMYVEADDDNVGVPIVRIGDWEPGEDCRARIITKPDSYKGVASTKVRRWLDPVDEEPEEDDEELEDEEPEEDEEPPARPARRARPAATRGTERAAKPTAPARTAKPATPAKRAASAPARRTTTTRKTRRQVSDGGYDEEPPF